MSHIQSLSEHKNICLTVGNCSAYNAQLLQEKRQIDAHTASLNQAAVSGGLLIVFIGLLVLSTPFFKPLQRVQKFVLPILAIMAPIVIGLIAGIIIGFVISFSACYKQECSSVESTAMLTLPAASLIVTIPITKRIFRLRQRMAESIMQPKLTRWIIAGILIVIFAVLNTTSTIKNNNRVNTTQKEYLELPKN